jgi:signal transduction histidine kinase
VSETLDIDVFEDEADSADDLRETLPFHDEEEAEAELVRQQQWALLIDNVPAALLGSTGCAVLVGTAIWLMTGKPWPLLWAASLSGLNCWRGLVVRHYQRRSRLDKPARTRRNHFILAGMLLAGLCWGVGSTLLLSTDASRAEQIYGLVSFFAAGLSASAAAAMAPVFIVYAAFQFAYTPLLAVSLILQGGTVPVTMGLAILLFTGLMAWMSWNQANKITETLRLRFKNLMLVNQLGEARLDAEAANRAKSQFLASMSHELRTPLNAILGFSEVLSRQTAESGNKTQADYAEGILGSGRHLLGLIEDILSLASAESDDPMMEPEPVKLEEIIESCRQMMQLQADQASVYFAIRIAERLPPIIGDPRKLKQILLNLIANAIKFNRPGGAVRIAAGQDDLEEVWFEVADTGVGMSRDEIPRALEPFARLAGRDVRNAAGAGIGLPLTERLVRLHGGRMEIESHPGIGTRVRIHLPLVLPAESVRLESDSR